MKGAKDRLHKVIVIGATPAGIAATNKLGKLGVPVTLVDSDFNIDSKLSNKDWKLNSGVQFNHAYRSELIRILRNPGMKSVLPGKVNYIKHSSQGFRVSLTRLQTFVDSETCTMCGRCVDICPVLTEENEKAIKPYDRQSLPGRPVIDKRQLPLCRENCPLGVNAQGYIALAKKGNFIEAFELIREENVLPGICGRICIHPCEETCRRQEIDEPVSVRNIKRFVADYAAENKDRIKNKPLNIKKRKEKIAVVGSGPSGLAAAAELARYGCKVTVFEKEKMIGGLLRYGIGPHRLPRNILDAEIQYIKKLGVEFKTSTPVDLKSNFKNLKKDFNAVMISTGTWKDRKLNVPGEDIQGVEGCLSFLNRFYNGEEKEVREKVAVIGDGNAAYDLARILFRTGAEVTIISWFSRDKIPADPEEVQAADKEGIKLKADTQVIQFLADKNRLSSILCKPTQPGEPDENGIAWPVIIQDSEQFELKFDRAFVAIGQKGTFESNGSSLKESKSGYIESDEFNRTNIANVYASGDAITGPSSVVHAMADGKKAARRILLDICKIQVPELLANRPSENSFPEIPKHIPTQPRAPMQETQSLIRKNNFAEVSVGLLKSQVVDEANRCLQCGVCSECLECVKVCQNIVAIEHNQPPENRVELAGVVIIADPEIAPQVKGDDIVRAYGPKLSKPDVYAMIMRGFAAAANAVVLLGKTSEMQKGRGISFSHPGPGLYPDIRTGVFLCKCNDSMGWTNNLDAYVRDLNSEKNIVHVETVSSACVPVETANIIKTVREKGITRIVLGSCVCCPLDFVCCACTDQRSRLKNNLFTATGISRSMVVTCNIRGEALSLIHQEPALAEETLKGLINRGIKRANNLQLFPTPVRVYNFTTALIGESEAIIHSAQTLLDMGLEIFFFGPSNRLPDNPNIHSFKGFSVKNITGTLGDFQLTVENKGSKQNIQAGAVIMGNKSRKKIKYIQQHGLKSRILSFSMQTKGIKGIPFFDPGTTSIPGLFLADPSGINISKKRKGDAAALLAAAIMPRGPRQSKGFTVVVNQKRCRGCGRCVKACPYQAVTLRENSIGGWFAFVDEAFCKGCGNCISLCPSNAADSPYRDQAFLRQTLEEVLLQQ